jgi:16S rRNA (adenine1518-N6/adenine1519-N6)-dimethyltransferase
LFVRWLTMADWPPWWRSLTCMFQKEVAERIVAKPGTDAYGRLAVLAQWRARPSIAFSVHRSAFVPPPKVTSAVVHVVPDAQPRGVAIRTMETLTAAAFGQRRKMLRQSLKAMPGAVAALMEAGIDPERRAETLSIEEFIALGRILSRGS